MSGAELIAQERAEQQERHGYTPDSDRQYDGHELTDAAQSYVLAAVWAEREGAPLEAPPSEWPWEDRFWKPSDDPVHNLAKAGALIAAEIDRITT